MRLLLAGWDSPSRQSWTARFGLFRSLPNLWLASLSYPEGHTDLVQVSHLALRHLNHFFQSPPGLHVRSGPPIHCMLSLGSQGVPLSAVGLQQCHHLLLNSHFLEKHQDGAGIDRRRCTGRPCYKASCSWIYLK